MRKGSILQCKRTEAQAEQRQNGKMHHPSLVDYSFVEEVPQYTGKKGESNKNECRWNGFVYQDCELQRRRDGQQEVCRMKQELDKRLLSWQRDETKPHP